MPAQKYRPLEHKFYKDSGLFHQHIKKTKRTIDVNEFDKLTNINEKVAFLQKNGPNLEPKAELYACNA